MAFMSASSGIPALVAVVLANALACAGPRAQAPSKPFPERQARLAVPEPDPATRATVRQVLAANALEQVSASVTVDRGGKVIAVSFLSPGLTPAQQVEIRRAFARAPWRPAIGWDGEPAAESTATLVIHVRE